MNPVLLNDKLAQAGIIQRKNRIGLRCQWLLTDLGRQLAQPRGQCEFVLHAEKVKSLIQSGATATAEPTPWKDRIKAPDEFMTRNQMAGMFGLGVDGLSRMLQSKGYLARATMGNRGFILTDKGLQIGKPCAQIGTFLLNAQQVQKVLDLHVVGGDA
jgi:hypothetical protein